MILLAEIELKSLTSRWMIKVSLMAFGLTQSLITRVMTNIIFLLKLENLLSLLDCPNRKHSET